MDLDIFKQKYKEFEGIWGKDENGVEFIYARDLQKLLGYNSWDKFKKPIEKAKNSCEKNNYPISDHFSHVGKMIDLPKGAIRNVVDIKLTRYAGYLIAMNGDPRKSEIAFAQNYFAVQTRKFERIVERMDEVERLDSRERLKESEKEFGRVIYESGVKEKAFGRIKSRGDRAFFGGKNTQAMKRKLKIPKNKPLADYTNKAVNLGKALANTMTTLGVQRENAHGEESITPIHVKNNKSVRKALTDNEIYPEHLPPDEDIKKVERKTRKEEEQITKKKNESKTKK